MTGKKIANFFGRGRLARNNWLSRIVKALFFFFFLFLVYSKKTRTEWGTTGGQAKDRTIVVFVSIKAQQAGLQIVYRSWQARQSLIKQTEER